MLFRSIINCLGGTARKSGSIGVTADQISAFFTAADAYLAWSKTGLQATIAALGPATPTAHAATQVVVPDVLHSPAKGHTIWVGDLPGHAAHAGVAWDWVRVAPGVVAIANPMAMVTNLRLTGENGEFLPREAAARVLNMVVHTLPWQDEVHRALATTSH